MKYKTVTYRIRGLITEQTVLSDLDNVLNDYAKEGWKVLSVQLIGPSDFLIVLESGSE